MQPITKALLLGLQGDGGWGGVGGNIVVFSYFVILSIFQTLLKKHRAGCLNPKS